MTYLEASESITACVLCECIAWFLERVVSRRVPDSGRLRIM